MSKIVIAPYAAKLRSGNRNPKNYPYWVELIQRLNANGHEVVQIGAAGEELIEGTSERIIGWPFSKLRDVINNADLWISVDSWLPHFCHCERLKSGVVIWGKSSPQVWGYPDNENLFVSTEHFRPFQFQHWETEPYDPNVFPPVMQVVWAVERKLKASRKPAYAGIY